MIRTRKLLIWGKRTIDYGMGKAGGSLCSISGTESVMYVSPGSGRMITRNDSGFTPPIRRRGLHAGGNENCPVSFPRRNAPFPGVSGRFLLEGPVNAAASGTITIGEIIRYIEEKTGKKAVLSPGGRPHTMDSRDFP